MKKRTSICVALVVLSVALTAQAASWTKWREVMDGRTNAIDFRYAADTFDYDGQRLIDWQFRNRYGERVSFDYEIYFEVNGGEHKETGSIPLDRDEVRGNRRLGTKVICARIKNLRLSESQTKSSDKMNGSHLRVQLRLTHRHQSLTLYQNSSTMCVETFSCQWS